MKGMKKDDIVSSGVPSTWATRTACTQASRKRAEVGVTWVHSYVNEDKTKTFCVYDGPDAEAIRRAAERNGLPVDGVTRVSVLDPYFYQ